MAAQTRDLRFNITGNDSGASRTFAQVGRSADGLGSKLAGLGKGAALGGLGAVTVGLGGLAAGLFQGFKDAAALETILAKTNAVITSTKGAANVSAKGVRNLADELESLSGIDGDAIIEAQNLLLTFTQVKNGTAELDKVFDQATQTAVDMAAALGSEPQQAAMQLGKALNDPIKGVSALSKVGVSFTEQQKKTIKSLVDSGRVMDAQKIILKELQVEFGGAAKAAGSGFEGAMARARDAIGDAFRDLATPLLPVVTEQLERFSNYMNTTGTPALMKFAEQFKDKEGAGGRFRDQLVEVWHALQDVGKFAKTAFDTIKPFIVWLGDHENVVKGVAVAFVALKVGLAGVAAANFLGISAGIAGIGAASAGAAGGVGAFGASIGALAAVGGPILLATAALATFLELVRRTQKVTDGGTVTAPGYGEEYTGPDGKPVPLPPLTPGRPLPGAPKPAGARPTSGSTNPGFSNLTIRNVVVLDGKEVAVSVNRHNSRAAANGSVMAR